MAFTGSEDHIISLEHAAELTANYRGTHAAPGYVKGAYYGREGLETVLAQEGCVGIRIYYGRSDAGIPELVIVGVDRNEDDIVDGVILDKGTACPPSCGAANVLNS